jgi:hypothetical protein
MRSISFSRKGAQPSPVSFLCLPILNSRQMARMRQEMLILEEEEELRREEERKVR